MLELTMNEVRDIYGGSIGTDAAAGALGGAITGTKAGAAAGPWGIVGGALIGAAVGVWSGAIAGYAFSDFSTKLSLKSPSHIKLDGDKSIKGWRDVR